MDSLLTKQDNRRYKLVALLSKDADWIILSKLAGQLDCSSRILKDDILFLNKRYSEFTIRTSSQGVRIKYKENRGFKTFSQKVLEYSDAYQLLETVFLNPTLTVQELAETLFLSTATVYRLIDKLNESLTPKHQFYINTNPCRLVGNEEKLRYYFYIYFFEKYSHFDLPFTDVNKGTADAFLRALLKDFTYPIDFAFYNVTKVVMLVNLERYRHQFFIEVEEDNLAAPRLAASFDDYADLFEPYEEVLGVNIDSEFIQQVFTPYIQEGMSNSYALFIEKVKNKPEWRKRYDFLNDFLTCLTEKYDLMLENKEALLFGFFNVIHLEYQDPQSNYILYKRNQIFTNDIKHEFPLFYNDLLEGVRAFRQMIGRPTDDEGNSFFMYNIFAVWKDLVPQMRNKIAKIKTLVISDRHQAHADMIKGFIEYAFSTQITTDFFSDMELTPDTIEKLDYDLIVTTFPIKDTKNMRTVHIPNVPKYIDYMIFKNILTKLTINESVKIKSKKSEGASIAILHSFLG